MPNKISSAAINSLLTCLHHQIKHTALYLCMIILFVLSGLLSGCTSGQNVSSSKEIQKLVIPGDFPDPSVIRVGNTYWATCSSSEWGPVFWLAKSTNLTDWEIVNYAFQSRPEWSVANYWAPELYYDGKKFFIFYTGRIKGGPLCVSIATADSIKGPWEDHGPVVCQEAGSIDASCIQDEKGQKYMVWKEDGNSVGKPTPIWAQRLSENGTALVSEKFELFRNDTPWEGTLVEGPFIMKKGDYYYCFYAGAGCCGAGCNYAVGVARSKTLDGKWEKYSKNPILSGNDVWKCPGHGTVVNDTLGKSYFLYHAYNAQSTVYVGRQALLSEIIWNSEGWPEIKKNAEVLQSATNNSPNFSDEFTSLAPTWRWPVELKPVYKTEQDFLLLTGTGESNDNKTGSVLAQATLSYSYEATTSIKVQESTFSGLSGFGDINNAVGISANKDKIIIWKVQGNKRTIVAQTNTPAVTTIQFKLVTQQGNHLQFFYSIDGQKWESPGGVLNGDFLPPWDRSVRVALVSQGEGLSYFDWFRMKEL